jgi:hypothetical protein
VKTKDKTIYECRCNRRLQSKRFTCLSHTGLVVELEHLKIKTRLTKEKFASLKGECEFVCHALKDFHLPFFRGKKKDF